MQKLETLRKNRNMKKYYFKILNTEKYEWKLTNMCRNRKNNPDQKMFQCKGKIFSNYLLHFVCTVIIKENSHMKLNWFV